MHHPQSSLTDTDAVLRDLARAKALFQMRALAAVIGCPSIIRDVDGDGLMLTVEPLQHIPMPDGRTTGSAAANLTPCGGAHSSFLLHEGADR